MNRNIKITNTTQESTNHLKRVPLFLEDHPETHLRTYAENVYFAGREALTSGKFHDMFMAGNGHELEDFTDENGKLHVAHARSIFSSSMLAYNFFHWISPEHPLTLNGTTYDKVYFEVKFPIFTKTTKGRLVNHPSNMDVVLISDDCAAMLCIESKYTEHSHHQAAEFADAYFKPACYYKGNPYIKSFIRMALRYNEQKNGYFAGIKQNVSHLIGITNVMHDADALAWFKANNPFIESEVMDKIGAHTEFVFSNLLYCRPEKVDDFFGDLNAEEKSYPYLLGELLFEHLQKEMDEPLLLSRFIITYPELFKEVNSQMQKTLADYLDNRYVLTPQPHFPLPQGYDTADHYLIDVVMDGARKRYQNDFTDEVAARINRELSAIRLRKVADIFLITWDYIRELHQHGFCTAPGANRTAGSIVAYSLGITDVEPIRANLSEAGLLYRPALPDLFIELSISGTSFAEQYLHEKYGELASKISYRDYYVVDIVEQTIANLELDINFSTIPYDNPELLRYFMSDDKWLQYTYFGRADMERLRAVVNPTLEDMVRIFADRPFRDGTHTIISREHSYGRCVLFLRTAWLKMHFPATFKKVADAKHPLKTEEKSENSPMLPDFEVPKDFDSADAYLRHLVMSGAQERYGDERLKEDAALINCINLELDTIAKAGISPYFLYLWGYVRKIRETKLVGPGRGSSAGSIVNYCLYITGVDPLKNGLLFERFYNPERASLPDIDIDIEDDEPWMDIKKIDDRSKIFGSSHILELRVLSTIKYFLPQLKSILCMDLENIPLDDPKTFRIFQEGDTKDVFQFQSEGMQEYLRELKPDNFSELVALNTMYRPGSMEFIPSYIRRKQGEETITYEFPVMEKYLKETYGLTIYQEQVMMLAQEIASFTPNESDNLRRALSRKSVAELVELHVRFIDGGQKNGYPQKALERIWRYWEMNASYFFNKSHAVCYTLLAYQDAYIKRQLRDGVFGIPSGFKELDQVTGGWHKSDLIVIGARPAAGKTSLMLTMAKEMGVREHPVAIISLEMSNIQLVCRLIMNVGEIKYEKIKAGKLSKTDEKRLNTKINILKGLPIYLEDTHSLSIIELIKKAYKLVYTKGVKVIFIDYLQLLSAAGMQYNNRAQELSIIIHELKNLAVDLQVPIIAFSQLNRSKEGSNLPQVTDIRESGDIANVADVVCLIHRPKDSDLAQIFVAKDQWGKLGTVELRFKKEYLRFENK
jgi:hypothetical protein